MEGVWIPIPILVLLYFVYLVCLYFYKRAHHEPIDPCEENKGAKLLKEYRKAKKKEMRMKKKAERTRSSIQ